MTERQAGDPPVDCDQDHPQGLSVPVMMENSPEPVVPASFEELVQLRRQWIQDSLVPWCRAARRIELLQAEQEWVDLAGRPTPGATLWLWAWQRFPQLCVEGLTTINETCQVQVRLQSGETAQGFPDARNSQRGQLILLCPDNRVAGPFSIDDIVAVEQVPDNLARECPAHDPLADCDLSG